MTRHILIVEDEPVQAHALATVLRREYVEEDVAVDVFTDPLAALVHLRTRSYAVAISDYRMPSIDGIEFLKELRELCPETVRLMLTAAADLETAMTAINEAEVFRFIRKPWQADLCDAVRSALDRNLQLVEERRLVDEGRLQKDLQAGAGSEMRRPQEIEPGVTLVNWGPGGSVIAEDA